MILGNSSIRQAIIGKARFKHKNWQALSTLYLDFSFRNSDNKLF